MAEVIDRDLGWKRIVKKTRFLNGKEIRAGVLSSAGTESNGVPIAQVGAFNEYGTKASANRPWNVPARPFLSRTTDQKKGWRNNVSNAVDRVFGGAEVMGELNAVGETMKTDIKNVFGQVAMFKRLKPSTIKKKGHNLPLLDSGALYDAIDYEVK